MPKAGPNKRKRVPKLSFTETQGIGWHVSFRDPAIGSPTRHRFGIREKSREPEARVAYRGEANMYASPEDSLEGRTRKIAAVLTSMLYETTATFDVEGQLPPHAYIVRLDGTSRRYESQSDGFHAAAFADYIEERIDQERGVAVLSIAEMWITDKWDGVGRPSESADRYEVLAATAEVANNPTILYTWTIRRDDKGTATIDQMRRPVPCESGLFRLQGSWGRDA